MTAVSSASPGLDGPALLEFVESYRERAGVESGRVGVNGRVPDEDPSAIEAAGA